MLIVWVHIYEVTKWGPEHAGGEEQEAVEEDRERRKVGEKKDRTYIVISKRLGHCI